MPIYPYRGVLPRLGDRVFLAPSAELIGDVEVGSDVSFWFATVARGDVQQISIGDRTNVQDGSVLHVTHETHPLIIGSDVVIGHSAMVHGCTIRNGALVGIGARVLDGAVVGEGAQIGAGAVVAPGHNIPAGTLALGLPARPVRDLRDEESQAIRANSARYVRLKNEYRQEIGPGTAEASLVAQSSR